MALAPWTEEEVRSLASIGTGAKDTKDRVAGGKYPFFVRSQKVERIDSWSFDGEAVLTAGDGVGTGKVFHYIDGKFDYHQRVYRISNFRPDVSGRYFFHQFSRNFLARIESLTAKSSVDSVRMETIAGMLIPVPGRAEQDRIVRAIDDADDLIASLERLIAKKQAIKQGMMQQLLTGRTRLPGFTTTWRETSVGEVAHVNPEVLSASTDPRTLVDYISLENVEQGEILGHTQVRFGSAPSRARRVIREGDVLFGTVRPNLQSHAIYTGGLRRPIASTGFAVVRAVSKNSDAQFLFYLLMSDMTTAQIDRIIAGSNYPAVSSGDVRRLNLVIPPLEEQRAIGLVIADLDKSAAALKRRLTKARTIKTGMMQQLLTGRTRLPVEAAS